MRDFSQITDSHGLVRWLKLSLDHMRYKGREFISTGDIHGSPLEQGRMATTADLCADAGSGVSSITNNV